MQYKVAVSFVNGDGANFHETFKIYGHKLLETIKYVSLQICMGDKTDCHCKHINFSEIQKGP